MSVENLMYAISSAGMTPPRRIVEGRWLRFPGIGKPSSNRAGWCRVISPTLAIFGDWSSGFTQTWRDDSHRDDERSRKLLEESRARERRFLAEQREKQSQAAIKAQQMIAAAKSDTHPYLAKKGFSQRFGLISEGKLLVPVRDADDYNQVISAQLIAADGDKKFIPGGRTRMGIHRIGAAKAQRIVLCEGYATGLSIDAAMSRLSGTHAVIVCFSARNMELVSKRFPGAVVCADNDLSKTGEEFAKRTGLRWVMPEQVGDFNDMHQRDGIYAVMGSLRSAFAAPE